MNNTSRIVGLAAAARRANFFKCEDLHIVRVALALCSCELLRLRFWAVETFLRRDEDALVVDIGRLCAHSVGIGTVDHVEDGA